jgi:hypothetical protein
MPKGLLSNRLNSFQESELAFENSGVGSNGLRSSRIRKTNKKMNVKAFSESNNNSSGTGSSQGISDNNIFEECANASIGRFGTCGPGASYRAPKKRCSKQAICRLKQQASDMTGGGIEFDAQMNSFNVNVAPRRCCAVSLDLGTSFSNFN